jgi:hypothetical protein
LCVFNKPISLLLQETHSSAIRWHRQLSQSGILPTTMPFRLSTSRCLRYGSFLPWDFKDHSVSSACGSYGLKTKSKNHPHFLSNETIALYWSTNCIRRARSLFESRLVYWLYCLRIYVLFLIPSRVAKLTDQLTD